MKQRTRELLLATKAARHWNEDFDQKVDELMLIVGKVDSEQNVQQASEMLDIYRSRQRPSKSRKRKANYQDKPFEFLVFRN
jgi:hypothetical protein